MSQFRVERWTKIYAPNAATLRGQLAAEGYRVYQWSDQPGAFYGQHKHAEEQSHWIISGSLELTVGGQRYVLNAGDRDFMAAETYHTARVVGDAPVLYLIGEKIMTPPKRKRGRPRKVKE